jgi:hypothetical protein
MCNFWEVLVTYKSISAIIPHLSQNFSLEESVLHFVLYLYDYGILAFLYPVLTNGWRSIHEK